MWWLRKRTAPAPDDPRVLMLRPPAGYGDHLMLSAVLEGLKGEHPELRLFLAASHPEIFERNPHVEQVLRAGWLQRRQPELFARYQQIRPREPAERYLQLEGHLIDDLYAAVGIPLSSRPRQPRIYLSDLEIEYQARRLERLARPRIAVVPHGKTSVHLPNKLYPADQWEELSRLLRADAGSLLHLGARGDGPLLPGALDFREIGYRLTASVLQRCDLLVTHVSGLMHLAAAVRVPTVVLYGAAEHPSISGYPWNRNLYVPIECGPCWMEEPCSHHSCMRRLSPVAVREAVREEMARAGTERT